MTKIGISIAAIILVLISAWLFWNRSQHIEFKNILPNEITFCEEIISITQEPYSSLYKWLSSNQNGWQNSLNSYIPKSVFRGNEITINVLNEMIVVNYKNQYGKLNQVVRNYDGNSELQECN